MPFSIELLPFGLPDLMASVANTHSLTVADRYGLMAAICNEYLNEDERRAVNRLLRSVVRGRIRVVDSLSTVSRS